MKKKISKKKGKQKLKVLTEAVVETYLRNHGKITQTARDLKITHNTVYSHLRSKEGNEYRKKLLKDKTEMILILKEQIIRSIREGKIDPNHALTIASHWIGFSPEVRAIKAKIKIEGKQAEGSGSEPALTREEMDRLQVVWKESQKE